MHNLDLHAYACVRHNVIFLEIPLCIGHNNVKISLCGIGCASAEMMTLKTVFHILRTADNLKRFVRAVFFHPSKVVDMHYSIHNTVILVYLVLKLLH